jgi:hypothetical protein
MKNTLLSWVVFLTGLFYTFVGLALLFAPFWFLENVGQFPPFNRHYMGDLGTFTLPMGIGLLLAARHPWQHRLLIGVVAGANLLHSLNHLYDALGESLTHWLSDTVPLILFAVVFLWLYLYKAERVKG